MHWLTCTETHITIKALTNKLCDQDGNMGGRSIMSLSSEKCYKRKPSIIVRQHLLNILLRKYIRKVYGGDLVTDRAKQIDCQLLRQEYYSDINECLLNYCRITKHTKLLRKVNQFTLNNQREFIGAIKTSGSRKRKKLSSLKIVGENSRWVLFRPPLLPYVTSDTPSETRFCFR